MATVAGGKVYAAKERGEPIPPIWLIGPDGRPTTDASLYPAAGTLAPAAGHKGYGIALLIEALSGALAGAALTWQVGSWTVGDPARPTNHGAAFIAIDCDAIAGGDAFTRRIDALIDEIHAAPRADGVDRLYVPGEIEWANYDRQMAEGIRLPSDVMASLNEAAHLVGLSLEKELK
jgi:LDH2 family malate/lactate/ureidoglycolate dehydrogenase